MTLTDFRRDRLSLAIAADWLEEAHGGTNAGIAAGWLRAGEMPPSTGSGNGGGGHGSGGGYGYGDGDGGGDGYGGGGGGNSNGKPGWLKGVFFPREGEL